MPPQQRVQCADRRDLPQGRAARPVRASRQPASIGIREPEPTPAQLSPDEPVLLDQVCNCLPLPAIKPAGQRPEHHLHRHDVDHDA